MKHVAVFLALLALACPALADPAGIDVQTISTGAIAASDDYSTGAINASSIAGVFSLQLTVTGDGTAKVEYLCSNDGTTFVEPDSAGDGATVDGDVLTGLTKTSGENSDGSVFVQYSPHFAKYYKLRFTETGGVDTITVTGSLAKWVYDK